MLSYAQQNLEQVEEQSRHIRIMRDKTEKSIYKEMNVSKALPAPSSWHDIHLASSLKEGLCKDIASALASYFALVQDDERTGFPSPFTDTIQNREDEFFKAMDDLVFSDEKDSWVDLNWEKDRVRSIHRVGKKKKGQRYRCRTRPLSFNRSRDCVLLADPEKENLYAYMKLLPKGSGLNTKIDDGKLLDINTSQPFKVKSDTGLLVPIALGKRKLQYHKYILPCLEGWSKYKAAKLIRYDGPDSYRYNLNVSFEVDAPPAYEMQSVLGIDRGILFTMSYGIVDMDGRIIDMNHFDDGLRQLQIQLGKSIAAKQESGRSVTAKDYRGSQREEVLHHLVNAVLDAAVDHKAGIVTESLNIQVRGAWVKSCWAKLNGILQYKAKLRGVPFLGEVFAAYSSQICIHCGCGNIDHKRDGKPVVCKECGCVEHADEAAGVNIARRYFYRKKDWEKKNGYWGFHKSIALA